MAKIIGQLTSSGTLEISERITRHEHHNIYVKVSNFVTNVTLRIEDYTIAALTSDANDTINLNAQNESETLTGNGTYSYLIANKRMTNIRVNFVSGDATLDVYYEAW